MSGPRPSISEWPRRVADWLCGDREDYQAFQRRKATRPYRARRKACLWVWLVAAGLMLVCPAPACVLTLILLATLLSFTILDEA